MKSLPPKTSWTVEEALSMAIEGLSTAIQETLKDEDPVHRFNEVLRLATLGKAIGRQRARATKRVKDYLSPGNRARLGRVGGYGYNVGGLGGEDGVGEDLADVADMADADDGPRRGCEVGIQPAGGIDDAMGMFGGMTSAFGNMADVREREAESGARTDRARELSALIRARESATNERERMRLQSLIDRTLGALEVHTAPDPGAEDDAPLPGNMARADTVQAGDSILMPDNETWVEVEHVGPGATAGELMFLLTDNGFARKRPNEPVVVRRKSQITTYVRCTKPGCGTVHGDHWTDSSGRPLRCDACNSEMELNTTTLDTATTT